MNRLATSTLAASVLASTVTLAQPLSDYFPEATLAYVRVSQLPEFIEIADANLFSGILDDSDREAIIAQFNEHLDFDDETFEIEGLEYQGEPLTMESLIELLGQDIAIGITDIVEDEPEVVIMARFDGDYELLEQLQRLDRDEAVRDRLSIDQIDYRDVTYAIEGLTTKQSDRLIQPEYWALVNGIAIEASSEASLTATIDAILGDADRGRLTNSKRYTETMDATGPADMILYANLEPYWEQILTAIKEDGDEIPPNPLGITLDRLLAGLDLETFQTLFVGYDFQNNPNTISSGILIRERSGIFRLMTTEAYETDAWPAFFPKNATEASVSYFSMTEFWNQFLMLANEISPAFGMLYQIQLENMGKETGVDLDSALLQNFGDTIYYYTTPRSDIEAAIHTGESHDDILEQPVNTIYAIEIVDRQAMESAIKALIELASQGHEAITTFDVEGVTVYAPNLPMNEELGINFCFINDQLLVGIGEDNAIKTAIRRMLNPDDNGFEGADHFDLLPGPVSAVGYMNMGYLFDIFLLGFQQGSDYMFDSVDVLIGKVDNVSGFSYTTVEDTRILSKFYLFKNEGRFD